MEPALIEYKIKTFGVFRNVGGTAGIFSLMAPPQLKLTELRTFMIRELQSRFPEFDSSIVMASAFAEGTEMLQDADAVQMKNELVVLPPVCGG